MSFINKVIKRFDSDKTFSFNEIDPFKDVNGWISTGSPTLDLFLKTFGWPSGIIEVRGESQSGKTTISLQAMMQCMNKFGERAIVTILSSERRDNKSYAEQMGINTDGIIVHKVKTIEDVQNKVFQTIINTNKALEEHLESLAKNAKVKDDAKKKFLEEEKEKFGKLKFFFIWDALGQTSSSQELTKAIQNAEKDEEGKAALGSSARALSGFLRNAKALEDEELFTIMIINRAYDRVDGSPGKDSYGGKAIKLFPTMRCELARIQGIKIGETEVGQISKFTTIKTDFDAPKQSFNIEIGYGIGIVLSAQDVEFGIEHKVLEKFGIGGAKFKIGTKELAWKTRKELYQLYKDKNPLLKMLVSKLTKLAHDEVTKSRKK